MTEDTGRCAGGSLYDELLEAGFTHERAYATTRTVAVNCPDCRVEWNTAHPEDLVDEQEAQAWEDNVAEQLRQGGRCAFTARVIPLRQQGKARIVRGGDRTLSVPWCIVRVNGSTREGGGRHEQRRRCRRHRG